MLVGVPKEIKVHESRVALTPEGVFEFTRSGHEVLLKMVQVLDLQLAMPILLQQVLALRPILKNFGKMLI